MQPKEVSDVGRVVHFCLNFNQKIHQSINGYMKIASWDVAVFLPLGFDIDNKLNRPVSTITANVTSRANK